MSKRTITHITETKAIKTLLNNIPDHWVVREVSERDYGIDLIIEIFKKNDSDINGHPVYTTTGSVINVQLKGSMNGFNITKQESVNFYLSQSHLLYVEKFAIPFILILVDVANDDEDIYFLWLQKYIKLMLNKEEKTWRVNNNESPRFRVKIPRGNNLRENIDKLERIAHTLKYTEEAIEFLEIYSGIEKMIESTRSGCFDLDEVGCDYIIDEMNKIKHLSVLLEINEHGIGLKDLEKLIFYFCDIKGGAEQPNCDNYPEESICALNLMRDSCMTKLSIEEFTYEQTGDAPY